VTLKDTVYGFGFSEVKL